MRCSQPQGLSAGAKEFLAKNDGYKKEVIGTYGMCDELKLYKYCLVDGSVAEEYVQSSHWDSGPVIWLGLKWKEAKFEWSKIKIDSRMDENPTF